MTYYWFFSETMSLKGETKKRVFCLCHEIVVYDLGSYLILCPSVFHSSAVSSIFSPCISFLFRVKRDSNGQQSFPLYRPNAYPESHLFVVRNITESSEKYLTVMLFFVVVVLFFFLWCSHLFLQLDSSVFQKY